MYETTGAKVLRRLRQIAITGLSLRGQKSRIYSPSTATTSIPQLVHIQASDSHQEFYTHVSICSSARGNQLLAMAKPSADPSSFTLRGLDLVHAAHRYLVICRWSLRLFNHATRYADVVGLAQDLSVRIESPRAHRLINGAG